MNNIEPKKIVTAIIGEHSILTDIEVRGHHFQCDETEKYGGHDRFPDPYDYILSGLASCVAITLRQYADRHKMSLDRAEVRCSYKKNNDPATPKKDKITKSIKLIGTLSNHERARLMRAAKCPAHMMLERGIEIDTIPEQ